VIAHALEVEVDVQHREHEPQVDGDGGLQREQRLDPLLERVVAAVDLVVERDHLVGEVDVAAVEGVDRRPQGPQHDLPLLLQRLLEALELFVEDVARHPRMLSALAAPAAERVILRSVSRSERVSTAAFRSMHPDGVAELPGATALRMPEAHSSPMLNRIVGLGLAGTATEAQLDDAIAAMAGLRYYVSVSPGAEPAAIGDWLLARGFEPSWG
jgi:hypothetical protein